MSKSVIFALLSLGLGLGLVNPGSAGAAAQTQQNQSLQLPATTWVAKGVGGLTNPGSRLTLASVTATSEHGGRVSLVRTQAWLRTYQGPGLYDQAFDVVVSRNNQLCIEGYSFGIGTGFDFVTIQYDPDGTPRWTNRYDGPASSADYGRRVAADADGNIYVAGESANRAGGTDVATLKYSADGQAIWTNRYNLSGTNLHSLAGLGADPMGGCYIAVGSFSGDYQLTTIRYGPGGQPDWTNHFSGLPGGYDYPAGLAVDRHGHAVVVGNVRTEQGSSVVTLQYAPDGRALWTNHYVAVPSAIYPRELVLDAEGNVVITGETGVGGGVLHVYAAVKYDHAGRGLWTNVWVGPEYNGGAVNHVQIDGRGDVYLSGGSPGAEAPEADFTALKLDAAGVPVWTKRIIDLNQPSLSTVSIVADAAARFYFANNIVAPGQSWAELRIIQFASDGIPLGTNYAQGHPGVNRYPATMALDNNGNPIVVGYASSSVGTLGCLVVKFHDVVSYTPPANFVGTDTFTFTAFNEFGQSAVAVASVEVVPASPLRFVAGESQWTAAGFRIRLQGVQADVPVVLFASTNLVDWTPIDSNFQGNSFVDFLDFAAPPSPQRFYRAVQSR